MYSCLEKHLGLDSETMVRLHMLSGGHHTVSPTPKGERAGEAFLLATMHKLELDRRFVEKAQADLGVEPPQGWGSLSSEEILRIVATRALRWKLKRITRYQARSVMLRCLDMEKMDLRSAIQHAPLKDPASEMEGMRHLMSFARESLKRNHPPPSASMISEVLQSEYVTRQAVCGFSDKNFFKSREWKETRLACLSAYRKCKLCGRTTLEGAVLHVDHIKPRSLFPHLSLEPSNLQVLCSDCNVAKSNLVSVRY